MLEALEALGQVLAVELRVKVERVHLDQSLRTKNVEPRNID